MNQSFRQILCVAATGLLALTARAERQPFEAIATSISNPSISVSASASNLSDFVSAIINAEGSFQALDGQAYTASSTFLGVPNAITFNRNANGTSVTFGLSPIGFTRTFTGATSEAVDDQIDEFLKQEGAATYASFLKAVSERSPIAVTDGNPTAATASGANTLFVTEGFTPAEELAGTADGSQAARFTGFGIGFNGGKFEAAGFEGSNLDISITGLNFGLTERVRLVTPVGISFLKVADATVFGIGGGVALPIRLRMMGPTDAWNWRLTPSAGLNLRGSADLASGALLWQAGITNTLDFKATSKLVLCLVNQLTVHKSISVTYDDYDFDPDIDQQVLKTGIRAVTPLTSRLIGDAFIVDTRFLKDAAVEQFLTFGVAASLRASQNWNLTLGGNYDTGDDFKAWSVGLSSAWRW